jgi:hypothetical protein
MSVEVKNIIPPTPLTDSALSLYTSTNAKTIIDKMTATNKSGSNVLLTVHLVVSGGAASDSNLIIDEKTIFPNETYICPEALGHVLEAGSAIFAKSSTSSAIVFTASGRCVS